MLFSNISAVFSTFSRRRNPPLLQVRREKCRMTMKTRETGRPAAGAGRGKGQPAKTMRRHKGKNHYDRLPEGGYTVTLKLTDLIYAICVTLLSAAAFELFYRMTVRYHGKYRSDIQYYVDIIKDGGNHDQRLLGLVFSRLYAINGTTVEICIYLALVIAGIVLMNFVFIRFFLKQDGVAAPRSAIQLFSLTALFTGPIYFPVIHEYFYKFSFQSFAWHSPTQHSMIFFGLISVLCFLKMYLEYEKGVHPGWWIATMLAVLLSAYAKPGFFIDLGMAVVALFLIELFTEKELPFPKRLGRLFLMGCALIPAGVYMVILQTMEFADDEESSGSHIVIDPGHIFDKGHLLSGFICGLAFALVVIVVNHRKLLDRKYRFMFAIFVMGVLQWTLFTEVGARSTHGNFGWGRQVGNYMLTLTCVSLALENYFDRTGLFSGNRGKRIAYFTVIGILLLLHVLSQLRYFRLLLGGAGYNM